MIVTHKLLDCNAVIVTHKLLDRNAGIVTHKLLDCNEMIVTPNNNYWIAALRSFVNFLCSNKCDLYSYIDLRHVSLYFFSFSI